MNHGPHGIQQERRLFEIGEETAGSTGQRGKGKGKTSEQKERDRLRKIELRKLQKDGEHVRQIKDAPAWFPCSCCMAAIGIGSHSAGKLIGVSNTSVSRQWRDRGIKAQKPTVAGWYMAAKVARAAQKEADEAPLKAYKEAAMDEIRMHGSQKVFPDWGYEWTKQKAKESSSLKYSAMTDQEKKEFNRLVFLKRKARHAIDEKARIRHYNQIKKWSRDNPDRARAFIKKSVKKRKLIDPGFRAQCNLRNRFKEIMGVVLDPTRKWNSALIGCDTRQLASHLEAKFKQGMSWENYGTHWHVDHIVPVSKFDHNIPAHVRQCWHYANLQPLEASVNLAKSDRILIDTQLSLTI